MRILTADVDPLLADCLIRGLRVAGYATDQFADGHAFGLTARVIGGNKSGPGIAVSQSCGKSPHDMA